LNPHRSATEAGFSLIEVLVAVAIAAILLVPLVRNFSGNVGRSAAADASIEGTLLAESMLATLGARLPLPPGDDVVDEGPYSITASVQPYADARGTGQSVIPYELAVRVSWQDGRHQRSVTLRSIRLAATQ
jgi:prepilin-type N-terminal cleavage/methylation domain-containing protein